MSLLPCSICQYEESLLLNAHPAQPRQQIEQTCAAMGVKLELLAQRVSQMPAAILEQTGEDTRARHASDRH